MEFSSINEAMEAKKSTYNKFGGRKVFITYSNKGKICIFISIGTIERTHLVDFCYMVK